jgi:hypothetical protein
MIVREYQLRERGVGNKVPAQIVFIYETKQPFEKKSSLRAYCILPKHVQTPRCERIFVNARGDSGHVYAEGEHRNVWNSQFCSMSKQQWFDVFAYYSGENLAFRFRLVCTNIKPYYTRNMYIIRMYITVKVWKKTMENLRITDCFIDGSELPRTLWLALHITRTVLGKCV